MSGDDPRRTWASGAGGEGETREGRAAAPLTISDLGSVAALFNVEDGEKPFQNMVVSALQADLSLIFVITLDGRILFANDAGRRMTGLDDRTPSGQAFFQEYMHPDEKQRIESEVVPAVIANGQWFGEGRLISRDRAELTHVNLALYKVSQQKDQAVVGLLLVMTDISQRKLAEDALRESEEVFRQLAENINSVFVLTDLDEDRVIYASPSFERIFGRPWQEALQRSSDLLNVVHSDDQGAAIRAFGQRVGERIIKVEVRIVRADGETRWVEVRSFPVRDQNGLVYRRAGIVEDITEKKAASEELARKQKLMDGVLAASEVGICLLEGGLCTWANEAFTRIFGYTRESEYIGRPTEMVYQSAEEYQGVWERMSAALKQDRSYEYEFKLRRQNGEIFDAHIHVARLDQARPRQGLVVTIEDISHRKAAERALKESEARYRLLAENSTDIIVESSPDGVMRYVSPAVTGLLGYAPQELMGRHFSELLDPGERLEFMPALRQALKKGEVHTAEMQLRRKDGVPVWLATAARSWRNPETGRVESIIAGSRDVTDRRRAEAALRDSEEKYRMVVEHSISYIAVIQDGNFVFGNQRFWEAAGKTPDELSLTPLFDFIHPEDREMMIDRQIRRMTGGDVDEIVEFRVFAPSGRVGWLEARGAVIRWEGRPAHLIIFNNITARKKAEAELEKHRHNLENMVHSRTADLERVVFELNREITERKKAERVLIAQQRRLNQMAAELALAEERERRQIAMDLHDHIGQCLALSLMKLKSLGATLVEKDQAQALDEVLELLGQMARDTRSLTLELSPPILYELGLGAALEWLTEQVEEKHGLSVNFRLEDLDVEVPDDAGILLFRAVRELLMNVVKHAGATRAVVAMGREGGMLKIRVMDNGVGFDSAQAGLQSGASGGFGLFSIRERVNSFGGVFEVESKLGQGTRAVIRTPLHQ